LDSVEAALKNSEEVNLKLTRSRKEMEKKVHEMEKHMKDTNLKLLTTSGNLKIREEETAALKARLCLLDNKEGIKQKLDELAAHLMEKDALLGIAWEEIKIKDNMLDNAIKSLQKMNEERRIIFENSHKLKSQLTSNENLKMGNESHLKCLIAEKMQEIQQIKVENNNLADMIFGHEAMRGKMEEYVKAKR
jgi:hypothetical protein